MSVKSNVGGAGGSTMIASDVTYAAAAALKSGGTIVPGVLYHITDATQATTGTSHDVWVMGLEANQFSIDGSHTRGFMAQGSVDLTGGGAGSVDGITVDGVQVMSGAVAFNTDLETTAADVAANINAFTSAPNYDAVAAGSKVVVLGSVSDSSENGFVIVSTTTTITSTDVNMAGGVNSGEIEFSCVFDFDNNFITEVSDDKNNTVICSTPYQLAFGSSVIDVFPWTHPVCDGNLVSNCSFTAYGSNQAAQVLNNEISAIFGTVKIDNHQGSFNGNRITGTGGGQTITFRAAGNVSGNVFDSATTSLVTTSLEFVNNRFFDLSFCTVTGNAMVEGCMYSGFSNINATDDSVCNGVDNWNGTDVTLTNGGRVSNSKFTATTITSSVLLASDPSNDIDATFAIISLSNSAMMSRSLIKGGSTTSQITATNDADLDGCVITNGSDVVCTGGNFHGAVISDTANSTITLNTDGQENLVITAANNNYANTLALGNTTANEVDFNESSATNFTGDITVSIGAGTGTLDGFNDLTFAPVGATITVRASAGEVLTISPTLVASVAGDGPIIGSGATFDLDGDNGDEARFIVGQIDNGTVYTVVKLIGSNTYS